ncbi:MazG nucleotide pyrophosphohydrolase domain-containing protein [Gulosibacter sp. 10]|uniref:MazG nucleotide pyrophosphohydrolase domain-containing protein n=1 Tax=Gulosibacter sp. 10 TaxID=1255570 RepID=UPI00097F5244|nr:MazG nucleotide pyrophosphohydrolase domain-containing protein [Gulosibacter sp. 10]SJM66360.1 Nucleoside triphosphate pyrophosphohydrolase MazG [Gulosibacter sp. 10]
MQQEEPAARPPKHPELERLLETVARFRGEGGCAWYESQTHESLVPYLTEESAEVIDAIEEGAPGDLREELGDLLFQVLFHADIAAAAGEFTFEDVARDQAEKLLARNPHVFGPAPTRDMDEIIRLWEEAKAREKRDRTSVLDGVSHAMPALALAAKVLRRAERLGLETAPEALTGGVHGLEKEDSFGEALLAAVAAANQAGFDAEGSLRRAVRRLESRIREHEAAAAAEDSAEGR